MKSINKFFLGFLALSLITIVSCQKSDDDGPSAPTNPGVFTGNYLNPMTGAIASWAATSTTAVHDTVFGGLKITAKNATGDIIFITLPDTVEKVYDLFINTSAESTYESSTLAEIVTTRTNDVPTQENGLSPSKIQITDNGASDGRIKGTIFILNWYIVKSGVADDQRVALFTEGLFDIPLTLTGADIGGDDLSLSAKIDGAAFNPMVSSFGLMLSGTDLSTSKTIIIQLPSNTTTGSHAVNSTSDYSMTYSDGVTGYLSEGTINITAFSSSNQSATGTFQFTATPVSGGTSVSITEGAFSF